MTVQANVAESGALFYTWEPTMTSQERELLDRIQVGEEHFYTSALATASFLASQPPHGSAYVIGETGLTNALYAAGFSMNDVSPDYVVMGDTRSYNIELIERAVELVRQGARLIGPNSDLTGPVERGLVPSPGALIPPIEGATGREVN